MFNIVNSKGTNMSEVKTRNIFDISKEVDPNNPLETIELIRAFFELYKLQGAILADKKFRLDDIVHIVKAAPTVTRGFVGIQYVDDELLVVSDTGKEKIKEVFSELDLPNDQLEDLVAEYIEMLLKMVKVGRKTYDYINISGTDIE